MTQTKLATLAGGCFWCIEAAMKELDGVVETTAGYAGGHVDNPTYRQVNTGTTGHAEAVKVEYDPSRIGYEDVLRVFFSIHDPTQLNRQGPDVGSQYRSAIFTHDDEQQELARSFIRELEREGAIESYRNDEIVTEVAPLEIFWEAEATHQDYYEKNPGDYYCQFHADPKIETVRTRFSEMSKPT